MKFRVILTVLFIFPILVKGQSDVIFYSEAPMYVKYKANETDKGKSTSTTLYIDGSAKFTTGSSIEQKGRTEITKDFINAKDPGKDTGASKNLFINNTGGEGDGVIAFVGKGASGTSTLQKIYGVLPSGVAAGTTIDDQKTINWINFPTIAVEKGKPSLAEDWRETGYVAVDVTGALSVDYISAKDGNRFAVYAGYDAVGTNPRIIKSGYAKIKDVASTSSVLKMTEKDKAIYSQVNLSLYKYDGSNDDGKFVTGSNAPIADPATHAGSLRNSEGWNYLTGFTSPFVNLGADYMFYHALTEPHAESITSYEGPIVDPYRRLQRGVGYFMSMEVSHNDHDFIDSRWAFGGGNDILAANRARGGYVFNRLVFHDYLSKKNNGGTDTSGKMNNFSRFYYDETDHNTIHGSADRPIGGKGGQWIEYDRRAKQDKDRSRYEKMLDETFNIGKTEVVVSLRPGLNFLGNPFMVPISLNPLLGYDLDGTKKHNDMEYAVGIPELTPTGAAQNIQVSGVKTLGADLRAKYWLINEALIKYDDTEDLFRFKAKYDYISRSSGATLAVGNNVAGETGTGSDGSGISLNGIEPLKYLIAPMQMFCLQVGSKPINIKLDMNTLSTFGKTNFLKSTKEVTTDKELLRDWFVVEVRNEKEHSADRMSVVFNDEAKPYYTNDPYDTSKGISEKLEEFVPENPHYPGEHLKTRTKYEGTAGIVFTKSTDGEKLLGNAVPTNTKELGLFFLPPSSTQELTLKFYGLDNLESVQGVWLIDRHLNNKKVRIYPGDEYKFVSDVSTLNTYSTDNNRFILRFYDTDEDVISKDEDEIFCYYQGSTIYIDNLNQNDINSDVQVYDLQGRLIMKTKIDKAPSTDYLKSLSLGTYIVKITGKRNHTSKIVNSGK